MKNKTLKRAPRVGFTLIELLTVIAIIGILAAILIPVVGRVRDSARAAVCSSNIRQCGMGLLLLAESENGEIRVRGGAAGPPGTAWPDRLEQGGIISDREVFFCPTGRHGLSDIYADGAWAVRAGFGIFMVNDDRIFQPPGRIQVMSLGAGQPNLAMWILNVEHVQTASQYPLLADSMQADGNGIMRIGSITASGDAVAMRHSRRANIFFLDGHVEGADPNRMGRIGFQSGYGETSTETVTFNTSLFDR